MAEKESKNNITSQDSTISENLTELEPTPRDVIDYSDNGLSYVGLSFKERFNKRKNAEKAKLCTMTDKQKTRYILDYYKWHFIIFAIAILLIVSFIKIAYNASLPTAITLFVLNNESDAESYSSFPKELEKDYRDYYKTTSSDIHFQYSDSTPSKILSSNLNHTCNHQIVLFQDFPDDQRKRTNPTLLI